ncbi:MAG: DUF2066 domain-containing protein [Rhodospirillaceae bacterium]|nr:DUF2066 domain-containing protein [Rhodospirillaceae bacterium]
MRKSIGRTTRVRTCASMIGVATVLVPTLVFSAIFENLYTITIPLNPQVARPQVLRTDADFDRFAMGELLIRITGQRDAPAPPPPRYPGLGGGGGGGGGAPQPALLTLVRDAGRYVVQRGFADRENLLIVFDSLGLQQALTARNQPLWGEERPLTLLWVAIDGGPGERGILAASPSPVPGSETVEAAAAALREELLAAANQRGLPISLPLMDVQDLNSVNFIDVWGNFSERLNNASERYAPDAVLSGRIRLGEEGIETAQWTLLRGGNLRTLPGVAVRSGLDDLADLYALEFSGIGGATSTRLVVSGIESLDDYGRVMSYLESLSVLQSVQLEQLVDTEMTLRVEARGGALVLNRVLALGDVLSRSSAGGDEIGGELIYSLTR